MVTQNEIIECADKIEQICKNWPAKAFSHARWKDLAENVKEVYGHIDEMERPVPTSVAVAYTHINPDPNGTRVVRVPHAFPWAAYKGVNFVASASQVKTICGEMMAPMLLRIFLQAEEGTLQIHQVDVTRMGEDMGMVPVQPEAPRITTEEDLRRLLRTLMADMAFSHGQEWRVAAKGISGPTAQHPIHIIAIANWEDLGRSGLQGTVAQSESQQLILKMISSEMAARFGVYFFIASSNVVSSQDLPCVKRLDNGGIMMPDTTPLLKGAAFRKCPYPLNVLSPTESQLRTILDAHRNFVSGVFDDTEGDGIWQGNSAKGVRAVMGVTPEGTKQFFELGVGRANNAFHALVGGATGSGKSVLLNEIICSLAERYSPEELRFVLLDYKEGTEFAPYRQLPHVFALSIGSNAEFGLEALKWLRAETERRGQLFKNVGVSNLADYRKVTGEKMCRYIVVADEFQRLCTDAKFGEEARSVLNDLVRRTRSFGMNFILATQTLRDNSLEGEAKNQFACRICLSLAESETSYFLSSDNNAPALFSEKGQALVNYAQGMKTGNIIFRSGNPDALNGMFRTTDEINRLLKNLSQAAKERNMLPDTKYVYDGEDFADMTAVSVPENELAIGLSINLEASPYTLGRRHIGGGVLIVGNNEKKNACLLNAFVKQSEKIFGAASVIQTPAEYLDGGLQQPLTILNAPEGDFDIEEALLAWKEDCEKREQPREIQRNAAPTTAFAAPEGMANEFAELMQGLQSNMAAAAAMPVAGRDNAGGRAGRQSRRSREEHPLVLSLKTPADVNFLREARMSPSDFRVVIYLDMMSFNQVSGSYDRGELGASQVMVECPKGNTRKIRLGTWQ